MGGDSHACFCCYSFMLVCYVGYPALGAIISVPSIASATALMPVALLWDGLHRGYKGINDVIDFFDEVPDSATLSLDTRTDIKKDSSVFILEELQGDKLKNISLWTSTMEASMQSFKEKKSFSEQIKNLQL